VPQSLRGSEHRRRSPPRGRQCRTRSGCREAGGGTAAMRRRRRCRRRPWTV